MFESYSDYDNNRNMMYKQSQELFRSRPINWAKINNVGADPALNLPFQYWDSPYTNSYLYPNVEINPYRPDNEVATNVNFKQFLDKTIKKNNNYAYGGEILKNRNMLIFS